MLTKKDNHEMRKPIAYVIFFAFLSCANSLHAQNSANLPRARIKALNDAAPSYVKSAVPSIVSVLPQEIVATEVPGQLLKTRGLKPATGFFIGHGLVATAGHTVSQSKIAFARTVNLKCDFQTKLQCLSMDVFYGKNSNITIDEYSNEGKYLKNSIINYDVGYYFFETGQSNTEVLKIAGKPPSVKGAVFLLAPVYKNSRYQLEYSEGTVAKVVRSTGEANLIFIDAESEGCFSGAPVVDTGTGEVYGVVMGEYSFPPHRYTLAWSLPPLPILLKSRG